MKVFSPLFVVVAALASASVFAAGNPAALRAAADRAMLREQFCDAAYFYGRLDEQSPKAEMAILAASAAAQGGDRGGAVTMLEAFDTRFPGDPASASVAKRLETFKQAIARVGPGAACAVPAADCGNGLIEGAETCDDGNRAGGDSCPANCIDATPVPAPAPTPTPTPTPTTSPTPPPPTATTPAWAAPVTPTPTTTVEPTAAVEPTPTPQEPAPVDAPTTVEPETEPVVTQTDRVEPPPAAVGPGAPIAGIVLASVGGLVTAGGGVALGLGLVPAIAFLTGGGAQAAAANDYADAVDAFERRKAAGKAADAYAAQRTNANRWNNQGRWLAIGGGAGLAVGIGLVVGGVLLIVNNGADIDDDSDDDGNDDDKKVRDEDNDNDEER